MAVFSDQQEISTILPTLFYKSTLIIERVKNQYIEIEIHQYKSSLLLHKLFNRNEIQLIFGCLENYHKLLIDLESRGTVAYFLKKFQAVGKWLLIRVAYKTY